MNYNFKQLSTIVMVIQPDEKILAALLQFSIIYIKIGVYSFKSTFHKGSSIIHMEYLSPLPTNFKDRVLASSVVV